MVPDVKGGKNKRVSKADVALGIIRKLYAIESEIRELSVGEKKEKRQQRSLLVLKDFHNWLKKKITRLVPDSLIHKAIYYALNQWPKLVV